MSDPVLPFLGFLSLPPAIGLRRRRRALQRQLPLLASTLARSVHSGATLVVALGDAASSLGQPAGEDVAAVAAAIRRGVTVDAALAGWSDRSGSADVGLLVTAARLGHAHGGDLGVALDAVAITLSDRVEVADEARSLTSQARTSAAVLVALPPFGAACFAVLDPAVAALLLTTPIGWVCIVVGVALDLAGAWVLHRMVQRALR
jgi:tight adherence protein B